jgi:hypothetical protein
VLPALQDVVLQAPDDFSCRMGGGHSGKDGGDRTPANVNVLGQNFGPSEELLELLEPVLRLAKPTKKVTTHLRPPAVEVAAWVGLLLTCGYDGARGAGSAESRGAAGAVGPAG